MAPRKLDASASRPAARFVTAHSGARDKDGRLKPFHDAPAAFRPNLTPQQMLEKGMHGGIYFNPLGGKPGILYPRSRYPKGIPGVSIDEFPPEWFKGVPPGLYKSRKYSVQNNFYKVKSGLDQAGWESNGWINECDPRGWTQWYFRFYMGRRLDNGEDERQIGRWLGVAGDKGRWKQNLIGKCLRDRKAFDDPSVSPVVRQTLLHWAYELTEADFEKGARRVKTHGAYAIPADQLHGVTVKTQGKRKFTQGDDVQEASTKGERRCSVRRARTPTHVICVSSRGPLGMSQSTTRSKRKIVLRVPLVEEKDCRLQRRRRNRLPRVPRRESECWIVTWKRHHTSQIMRSSETKGSARI